MNTWGQRAVSLCLMVSATTLAGSLEFRPGIRSIPMNINLSPKHFPIHTGNATLQPTIIVLNGGAIEAEGIMSQIKQLPQNLQQPQIGVQNKTPMTGLQRLVRTPGMAIGQASELHTPMRLAVNRSIPYTRGYITFIGRVSNSTIGLAK